MAKPIKRTATCCVQVLEDLRHDRGYSVENLAAKAGVSARTVQRMLAGRAVYLESIRLVALQLGTSVKQLTQSTSEAKCSELRQDVGDGRFQMRLHLRGQFGTTGHAAELARLVPESLQRLKQSGVTIRQKASEVLLKQDPDGFKRRLVTLWLRHHDRKVNFYVGVKPSKYATFAKAVKNGTLDLRNFSRFGEFYTAYGKYHSAIQIMMDPPDFPYEDDIAYCGNTFEITGVDIDDLPKRLQSQYDEDALSQNSVACILDAKSLNWVLKKMMRQMGSGGCYW